MPQATPTLDSWRRLYEAALPLKKLAPWEGMAEDEVFGVQDPETGTIGFVSVMGLLGEHFGLAVYLGAEGLYQFWDVEIFAPDIAPQSVLEIPHLQASFEDRQLLESKDRKIIKDLGLQFRGKSAWPIFRSVRPGCPPWFLETEEIRFLTHVLEQSLDVLSRYQGDPSLLEPAGDESYLVRVPRREAGALKWEDRIFQIPPAGPRTISLAMNHQTLEDLKRLPQGDLQLELDLFMLPGIIQARKEDRPYHPYMLLMVETQRGLILGTDLLTPLPTLEAMWGQMPLQVAQQLVRIGHRPKAIKVQSTLLLGLLARLAETAPFELEQVDELAYLDEARASLMGEFAWFNPP